MRRLTFFIVLSLIALAANTPTRAEEGNACSSVDRTSPNSQAGPICDAVDLDKEASKRQKSQGAIYQAVAAMCTASCGYAAVIMAMNSHQDAQACNIARAAQLACTAASMGASFSDAAKTGEFMGIAGALASNIATGWNLYEEFDKNGLRRFNPLTGDKTSAEIDELRNGTSNDSFLEGQKSETQTNLDSVNKELEDINSEVAEKREAFLSSDPSKPGQMESRAAELKKLTDKQASLKEEKLNDSDYLTRKKTEKEELDAKNPDREGGPNDCVHLKDWALSCLPAVQSMMMAVDKKNGADRSEKSANNNIKLAEDLVSTSGGTRAPNAGGSVGGGSKGGGGSSAGMANNGSSNPNTDVKKKESACGGVDTKGGDSSAHSIVECAVAGDPNLANYFNSDRFKKDFEDTLNTPLEPFLAKAVNGSPSSSMGGGLSSALGASAASKAAEVAAQLEGMVAAPDSPEGAMYANGSNPQSSGGGKSPFADLFKGFPGLGGPEKKDHSKFDSDSLRFGLARLPASEISPDRSVSLFDRVTLKYHVVLPRLHAHEYTLPNNRYSNQ